MNEVIILESAAKYWWLIAALLPVVFTMTAALVITMIHAKRRVVVDIALVVGIVVLVGYLSLLYIADMNQFRTTKQYFTDCHQVDGKIYCVLKKGKVND